MTPAPSPSLGVNGFPVEIDGLPVVSVAQAKQLLDAGKLDGRVVAIAAFYSVVPHSCPSSAWADGPLQSSPSCVAVGFADNEADARACHHIRNGMACESSPLPIVALPMPETTGGGAAAHDPADFYKPTQIVVLAHSGDARQWQCAPVALEECKRALVADQFAWVNGSTFAPEEPELWDSGGDHQIPLRMSLADVQAAVGGAR